MLRMLAMPLDDLLGRRATLRIRRLATSGAYLAREQDTDRDAILLPGAQVHPGANVGDEVDVFVHRDAEGRPLATRRVAKLELGQVAFLEVTALSSFGAFVDWGLPKELLVPFAEQTAEMRVGERYAIGLYLDSSGRLAGTMRVAEMVGRPDAQIAWEPDEWVEGEAWRDDPEIGLFVIVEKELVGLVPRVEPHSLSRGQAARFRVSNVLPDGRIELSLRGYAHQELASDGKRILALLSRGEAPRIGDRSSPEEIRRLLGLSKKAFKRAAGRLLKEGAVSLDGEGFLTRAR
jgi:predicted RNA-binding protein (virulence factor B family)